MDSPTLVSTRITLIRRAASSGKSRAWEELVASYTPFIDKILVHLGFRHNELEDLRQEILLRLWKGLSTYRIDDPNTRFRAWLSRVIRNAASNHQRSANRRPQFVALLESDTLSENPPSDLEQHISDEWQAHVVHLALSRVEKVFTGTATEVARLTLLGKSAAAIAEELGLKEQSVYVLRHRVQRRLTLEIAAIRNELEGNG